MNVIYAVFLTFGEYEDVVQKPLRSFASKSEVETYIEEQTRHIAHNLGKMAAIDAIMADMWDKVNPGPTYPEEGALTSQWEAYHKASNTHLEARVAELKRLQQVVGYDTTIGFHWYHETWHLYLQEIPFGPQVDEEEAPVSARPLTYEEEQRANAGPDIYGIHV